MSPSIQAENWNLSGKPQVQGGIAVSKKLYAPKKLGLEPTITTVVESFYSFNFGLVVNFLTIAASTKCETPKSGTFFAIKKFFS